MRTRWFLAAVAAAALLAGHTVATGSEKPGTALERLRVGNARFVANAAEPLPVDAERRQAQTKGQSPFAIVLSCADSRVPPEIIFNVGLGELFVVRSAGEVTDKAVLASMEYAADHLHSPLLVVMGHESCGAVKAATDTKPGSASMGPNLDYLVKSIQPAFGRMATPADQEHIREATLANVEQVVNDILEQSSIIRHLQHEGTLQLVGAYYELSTGRVRFSEPVKAESVTTSAAAAHR